jgi:hypothetical protein
MKIIVCHPPDKFKVLECGAGATQEYQFERLNLCERFADSPKKGFQSSISTHSPRVLTRKAID